MIAALTRLPLARLTRTPRAWVPVIGWATLALVAAYVAGLRGPEHGADHALLGPFAGIALPLLVYGLVSAALGGEGLAKSGASLVSFGAAPALVAAVQVLVAALVSALLGAALAAGVAAMAHGAGDPPLAKDVLMSAWIGALGGATYAALFALGSSFGARGAGRSVFLILDWVLGAGTGGLSVITPRAHLRNLLGGESSLELAQRASVTALAGLAVAFAALAVLRSRKA